MTLNQLYYFEAVAECENYHLAAEKLFISQPSLSRAMASLEEELGVQLFEKEGRGIVLTKAGHLFLEYVQKITTLCHIATEKMKELSVDGGRIDIAYVFPLANQYMPHKVRKFLERSENKNVTFSIFQGSTTQIMEKMRSGQVDVGFCGYEPNNDEMEYFPIANQKMIIIVPKEHPLAAYDAASVTELTRYPVIGYERKCWLGKFTADLYRRLGVEPNIVFECPDENSIQALVQENFGIAIIPRVDTLDEERVKALEIEDTTLVNRIFMVWRKGHYMLPATIRFIEYMKENALIP